MAAKQKDQFDLLGLGCGIDATNPAPLKSKKFPVRSILPGPKSNVVVNSASPPTISKYSESIESMQTLKTTISASVGDITGQVVNGLVEGEYARDIRKQMDVAGEKKITRTVYFQPYSSEKYAAAGSVTPGDNDFEKKLYEWFIESIPNIKKDANAEVQLQNIYKYVGGSSTALNIGIDAAYAFIKSEGITHYVNHLDLGASKYAVSTTSSKSIAKKVTASVKAPYVSKAGGGVESTDSQSIKKSSEQTIGDFETVDAGSGEGVVGYKIKPLFTLVRNSNMMKVVQAATLQYLEKASGPFIISGGYKNDIYLKIVSDDVKQTKEVHGTMAKDTASLFYIEKSVGKGEFTIAYHMEQSDDKSRTKRRLQFLTTNSRLTGKDPGPLCVGKSRSTKYGAKFVLVFPTKKIGEVSIGFWETNTCYLRVAPRRLFQKKSYVGLKENKVKPEDSSAVCVHQMKDEGGVDNVWLSFQLHRPAGDDVRRVTVFSKPLGPSGTKGGDDGDDIDDEEDEFDDFAFEFEQKLDEDEQ